MTSFRAPMREPQAKARALALAEQWVTGPSLDHRLDSQALFMLVEDNDFLRVQLEECQQAHAACDDCLDNTKAELEQERVRLAACGVVAMSDTPESADKARCLEDDYAHSASMDDVARRVDECMELRAELVRVRELLHASRTETLLWCADQLDDLPRDGTAWCEGDQGRWAAILAIRALASECSAR